MDIFTSIRYSSIYLGSIKKDAYLFDLTWKFCGKC